MSTPRGLWLSPGSGRLEVNLSTVLGRPSERANSPEIVFSGGAGDRPLSGVLSHSVELLGPDVVKLFDLSHIWRWISCGRIPVAGDPPRPATDACDLDGSSGFIRRFRVLPRILGRYSQSSSTPEARHRAHGLTPSHRSFCRLHAEQALVIRGTPGLCEVAESPGGVAENVDDEVAASGPMPADMFRNHRKRCAKNYTVSVRS